MDMTQKIIFFVTSLLTIVLELDAVKVNPSLCPTNKVAPHRRSTREQSKPRTFGLIYNLVTPGRPRPRPPPINDFNELQEQLQEDDPDDCGEIEDYDETDLSSIKPSGQNYIYNKRGQRFFFDHNYINYPAYYQAPNRPVWPPYRPSHRPSISQRPQKPTYVSTKPPFSSGGIFGSNFYRPPTQHYPSNHIKPVHEDFYDTPPDAYRPGLVGGAIGHVIGFSQKRPTFSDEEVTLQKYPNFIRFPDSGSYNNRYTRAKPPNLSTRIIGSFVNLLFH